MRPPFWRQIAAQLGLLAPSISREVLIGLLLGVCAWAAVLLALLAAALAIYAIGGEKALPKPSAIVPWIASLPVLVRLMVSLSAGFVEEIFFRGFLQPRVGLMVSSVMFALSHFSYGLPFMIVGVFTISLVIGRSFERSGDLLPCIVAHGVFDSIQMFIVIPLLLKQVPNL